MANLYKEAAKRKKIVPGGEGETQEQIQEQTQEQTVQETTAPEIPVEKETPAESVKETPAAPEKAPEPVKEEPQKSLFDLDSIEFAGRPEKKSYSLYLSVATMNEVEKRARKARMAPSAYLDELLKRGFGL